MREHPCFRGALALLACISLVGSVYLMCFQILLSDDTMWARGYRAGSKLLSLATFLDVLSGVITFVFFLHMVKHYDVSWWNHFNGGGVEWTFLAFAQLLKGCALIFYGISFLLLELYHDEGTNDW
eukprot:Lankesteria_metandrocarpae@DN8094_c0_g1_i1.p1